MTHSCEKLHQLLFSRVVISDIVAELPRRSQCAMADDASNQRPQEIRCIFFICLNEFNVRQHYKAV